MSEEPDLGMLFLPRLGLFVKVHQNRKGKFVYLPSHGKLYLSEVTKVQKEIEK